MFTFVSHPKPKYAVGAEVISSYFFEAECFCFDLVCINVLKFPIVNSDVIPFAQLFFSWLIDQAVCF